MTLHYRVPDRWAGTEKGWALDVDYSIEPPNLYDPAAVELHSVNAPGSKVDLADLLHPELISAIVDAAIWDADSKRGAAMAEEREA